MKNQRLHTKSPDRDGLFVEEETNAHILKLR